MVRVGTFNVENLFARFKFKGRRERYTKPDGSKGYRYVDYTDKELRQIASDGWMIDKTLFDIYDEAMRRITAKAIKELNADVLALQEVENLDVLKRFNSQYLKGMGYKYQLVIDGNDPRLIDVALLSKHPFEDIRTHQFDRSSKSFVFSRDCLEVDVRIPNEKFLPVFVNHFKSMLGGRDQTMPRRRVQTTRVVEILKERFGPNPGAKPFVVLGDFNDYMPSSGLQALLGQRWVENVIERRAEDERWTHYYAKENEYKQLDYILLSSSLAKKNRTATPTIVRNGMPKRATRVKEKRFDGVDWNDHKASDHCPVAIEIAV